MLTSDMPAQACQHCTPGCGAAAKADRREADAPRDVWGGSLLFGADGLTASY